MDWGGRHAGDFRRAEIGRGSGRRTYCDFCTTELDLGRKFVYQVESLQFESNPFVLEVIRRRPQYFGEPLRFCKACYASLEANWRALKEEARLCAETTTAAWRFLRVAMSVPIALAVALLILAIVHAIAR